MVILSRIYTRTGDAGNTRLSDNSVARKTDPRVQTYGAVDEANSVLGVALADSQLPARLREMLGVVQNELFDVGADLSTPLAENPEWPPLRIEQPSVDRLEAWCDELNEHLPTLRSFILPGGTPAAAQLHVARTIVRRAERLAWEAIETFGDQPGSVEAPSGVHELAAVYLNRLSDLLFLMARTANGELGEVLWVPGGERNSEATATA